MHFSLEFVILCIPVYSYNCVRVVADGGFLYERATQRIINTKFIEKPVCKWCKIRLEKSSFLLNYFIPNASSPPLLPLIKPIDYFIFIYNYTISHYSL